MSAESVPSPPYKVRALYDYSSPHDDDLNFVTGQAVLVTSEEDDDWSYGEYTGSEGQLVKGIFPRTFVELIPTDSVRTIATPPRPTKVQSIAKANVIDKPKGENSQEVKERNVQAPKIDQNENKYRPGTVTSDAMIPEFDNQTRDSQPLKTSEFAVRQKEGTNSNLVMPPSSSSPALSKDVSKASSREVSGEEQGSTSGSFRDRIAAFNKPAALPIAPQQTAKPSTTFIKKPFVPPPPSKNAYVAMPPAKATISRPIEEPARDAELTDPHDHSTSKEGSDVKISSLKDRIALLKSMQLDPSGASKGKKVTKPARSDIVDNISSHDSTERGQTDSVQEDARTSAMPLDKAGEDVYGEKYNSAKVVVSPAGGLGNVSDDCEATEITKDVSTRLSQMPLINTKPGAKNVDEEDEDPQTAISVGIEKGHGLILPINSTETSGRNAMTMQAEAKIAGGGMVKLEGEEEGETKEVEQDEDEEESPGEEVDPEVARRLAIRERMMKMSGGMGMYGIMPPVQQPIPPSRKPRVQTEADESRRTHQEIHETGFDRTDDQESEIRGKDYGSPSSSILREQHPSKVHSEGSLSRQQTSPEHTRVSGDSRREKQVYDPVEGAFKKEPMSELSETSVRAEIFRPEMSIKTKSGDLDENSDRSEQTRSPISYMPTPQPKFDENPTEGSASDDEMSVQGSRNKVNPAVGSPDLIQQHAGSTSMSPVMPPVISPVIRRQSYYGASPASPSSPIAPNLNKRMSYHSKGGPMPPVPAGGAMTLVQATPISRPPPPPPPASPSLQGASSRTTVFTQPSGKEYLASSTMHYNEDDGEVTEYEADYDTDLGSGEGHKDALKVHGHHGKGYNDVLPSPSYTERAYIATAQLPLLPRGPPPAPPKLAPPPPPPTSPPQPSRNRDSVDMPRSAPPPPPPPANTITLVPQPSESFILEDESEKAEEIDDQEHASIEDETTFADPSAASHSSLKGPFQTNLPHSNLQAGTNRTSVDLLRAASNTNSRRSTDINRMAVDRDHMAREQDLGESSNWWTQANTPPPVFQNRSKELTYEIEDSSISRRGGRTLITRDVYVLFPDYSQTIVTARYDREDSAGAILEQRHEPPPPQLRQDQLEAASNKFGSKIMDSLTARQNTVVGDGDALTLVLELFKSLPGALSPVGTRSFGALVYSNLGNATIQQYDEIRPGDIVTFRNAKFQGHKGGLHQKYSFEVATKGKGEHIGVVLDWDGTKKKLRAYEQGRESKKVKVESFRLGDLKSGECKVWRVVGRNFVGWETQS